MARLGPSSTSATDLKARGVKLVPGHKNPVMVECLECGSRWFANKGWVCPSGCNDPTKKAEAMSQLSVHIPAALHRSVKVRASATGVSVKQLVIKALEREVKPKRNVPDVPPTIITLEDE